MRLLGFFTVSLCAFMTANGQNWERMPGQAMQISAKGYEVWAITKYYKPMRLVDGKWRYAGKWYRGTHVAAIPEGLAYLVNRLDDDQTVRLRVYDPRTDTFEPVRDASKTPSRHRDLLRPPPSPDKSDASAMTNVNAAGQDKVVGVVSNGCVWRLANGGSSILSDDRDSRCGDTLQVAIGEKNETWKIDLNGKLFHYSLGAWVKHQQPNDGTNDKSLVHIDIQDRERAIAVDNEQRAWMWDGKLWKPIGPGAVQCIQASVGYDRAYCVDPNGSIWTMSENAVA